MSGEDTGIQCWVDGFGISRHAAFTTRWNKLSLHFQVTSKWEWHCSARCATVFKVSSLFSLTDKTMIFPEVRIGAEQDCMEWVAALTADERKKWFVEKICQHGRMLRQGGQAGDGGIRDSASNLPWMESGRVLMLLLRLSKTNNAVDPQRLSGWDQTPSPSLLLEIDHRKQCVCVCVCVCNYTLSHRFPPWRTAWPDFLNGWNLESAALVPSRRHFCAVTLAAELKRIQP